MQQLYTLLKKGSLPCIHMSVEHQQITHRILSSWSQESPVPHLIMVSPCPRMLICQESQLLLLCLSTRSEMLQTTSEYLNLLFRLIKDQPYLISFILQYCMRISVVRPKCSQYYDNGRILSPIADQQIN